MDPTERSAPREFWEETFVTAQALFPTVLVAIGRLFHGQKALVNLLAKRNQLRVSTLALGCYLIEFVHLAYASFRMLGISCKNIFHRWDLQQDCGSIFPKSLLQTSIEIDFAERIEACKSGKKGDFEGEIGVFGVKKGQKWASLFTDW